MPLRRRVGEQSKRNKSSQVFLSSDTLGTSNKKQSLKSQSYWRRSGGRRLNADQGGGTSHDCKHFLLSVGGV